MKEGKQVANIVIYYCLYNGESVTKSVESVNTLINQLETQHTIKGVYIDNFNESNQLHELLNSPLGEVDYFYLNKPLLDEFDSQLINQLSKAEHFKVKYY